jgi:hypothetical protein
MSLATNWVDFGVALVWPLFAILVIALLSTGPGRQLVRPLLARLKTFKVGAFAFELTEEGATEARGTIEDNFRSYRTTIQREYDRQAHIYSIPEKHSAVMDHLRERGLLEKSVWRNLRSTIHVPDILFDDTLYQLLDYYPAGGGAGRAFPVRRGIIGLAWRKRDDEVEGTVPVGKPENLIVYWGMTRDEVTAAGQGRKSFLCVVLRDKAKSPVGVFYLDSRDDKAFGAVPNERNPEPKVSPEDEEKANAIISAIKSCADELKLTDALGTLGMAMRSRGPQVRIFDRA